MSKTLVKVIVHADDLGLTEKINEGIIQAHQHGILTSASIMANGEALRMLLPSPVRPRRWILGFI